MKHVAQWTGPLAASAPPQALFRALGDLTRALAPTVELKWFPGVGGVKGRVRAFGTWGGPRPANVGGAMDLEIEIEARERSWTITVRRGNTQKNPELPEASKDLTNEEWDGLVTAIAESKFSGWDETKERGMPDWGTAGIELELDGKGVQKLWHGTTAVEAPGQVAWNAIEALAKKKGLDVEVK